MVDLASLVAPLEGDPVGPDLSYDAGRTAIEGAFAVDGEGRRPENVDWPEVIRQIRDQALLTRDLWLGIYLARAGAMAGQLPVVAEGAQLLAALLEQFWDQVHPQLEESGFDGRRRACDSLANNGEFLLPLKRVVLIAHKRLGSYTALDLERFEREGDAADGYGKFRAALEQIDPADIEAAIDSLDQIRDALRRSGAVLDAHAGEDAGTDFQPTFQALAQIRAALARHAPSAQADGEAEPVGDAATVADEEAEAMPRTPAAGGSVAGRIETRDDVLRALDAIGDYYRRREPGSAVPLALRRAREWVPMTFIEVLRDIAPASMDDARRVLMSQAMVTEAGLE